MAALPSTACCKVRVVRTGIKQSVISYVSSSIFVHIKDTRTRTNIMLVPISLSITCASWAISKMTIRPGFSGTVPIFNDVLLLLLLSSDTAYKAQGCSVVPKIIGVKD